MDKTVKIPLNTMGNPLLTPDPSKLIIQGAYLEVPISDPTRVLDPSLLPPKYSYANPDATVINTQAPEENYIDQSIQLSNGTKAACTTCGREDAPFLFLKRSNGLYELLCKDFDASGCWPQSARTTCGYADHRGVQCLQIAEFKIQCGMDPIRSYSTCGEHISQFAHDFSIYKLYPLDKD